MAEIKAHLNKSVIADCTIIVNGFKYQLGNMIVYESTTDSNVTIVAKDNSNNSIEIQLKKV